MVEVLPVLWELTLPGRDGEPAENNPHGVYLDPVTWPGDWTAWGNSLRLGFWAFDEDQARTLAAEHDCAIWKDPRYSRCSAMDSDTVGLAFDVRGGADNE